MNSISLQELEDLATALLQKQGASLSEAKIVYEDYLYAEASGRVSHGFASFEVALAAFPTQGSPQTVKKTSNLISIDGAGTSGHITARHAIDKILNNQDTAIIAI